MIRVRSAASLLSDRRSPDISVVKVAELVWAPLGESRTFQDRKAPMARGPHEVGGAEPRAERHIK